MKFRPTPKRRTCSCDVTKSNSRRQGETRSLILAAIPAAERRHNLAQDVSPGSASKKGTKSRRDDRKPLDEIVRGSHASNVAKRRAAVIFQEVVHSTGTREADCSEQSPRGEIEWTFTRMPDLPCAGREDLVEYVARGVTLKLAAAPTSASLLKPPPSGCIVFGGRARPGCAIVLPALGAVRAGAPSALSERSHRPAASTAPRL